MKQGSVHWRERDVASTKGAPTARRPPGRRPNNGLLASFMLFQRRNLLGKQNIKLTRFRL